MRIMWLVALCVVGCGSGGPAGSCQIAASGSVGEQCIDFVKGYSATDAKNACAMASGSTYSGDTCPTANRIGHCTESSPDGAFTQTLSYYGPTTVADAMTNCTAQAGTFAAD
jgi:hypothetical protein